MHETVATLLTYGIPALVLIIVIGYVFSLRRIVPTNVVHIVQTNKRTVSYGVGNLSNVYYEFPKWLPVIGVEVRALPVSNFDIDLKNYSAYDKDRIPFVVDIKAFFHISDTNKAAQKVSSYEELKKQLEDVVKGAARSILAKSKLDEIMEERPVFGEKFTDSVKKDLENWGVEPIKNIELMDVRDSDNSEVIHNIMAKKISAIAMDSRKEVASNNKAAEQAELEARKEVDVTKAITEQAAGEARAKSTQAIDIAKAEATKKAGIAQQESESEIAKAKKITAEQNMEVLKVNTIRQADIDKEAAIVKANQEKEAAIIKANQDKEITEVNANAEKFKIQTNAEANLEAKKKEAQGTREVGTAEADVIKAKGLSEAEAATAKELAGVAAQEKIGNNKEYQAYMLELKKIEVSQVVGVSQYESIAKAIGEKAELKFLINSGDVHSGMSKLSDLFTSKGGSQINGFVESLGQTPIGKKLLALVESLPNPDAGADASKSEKK